MVIDDRDIPCPAITPHEADAKLIVDADTPLADTIAGKLLQPVLRRHTQRLDSCRGMHHLQLSHRYGGDVGESGHARALEQGFGIPAFECLDHDAHILTRGVSMCQHALVCRKSRTRARRPSIESNDFSITPAVGTGCAAGLTPIYRAYNNGYQRRVDSNHRITSDQDAAR